MRRACIILVVAICFAALSFLQDTFLVKYFAALPWDYSERLSELVTLLPTLLAICLVPLLRNIGTFKLRWTWVLIIPLSALAANLLFVDFGRAELSMLAVISLFLGNALAGTSEELFFRGLCFIRGGESTPKTTVLLSSFVFALLHIANYFYGASIKQVAFTILLAFPIAIAFGIIRVATGSIALCILTHSLINAFSPFVDNESRAFQAIACLIVFMMWIASLTLLFAHPKMRVERPLNEQSKPNKSMESNGFPDPR